MKSIVLSGVVSFFLLFPGSLSYEGPLRHLDNLKVAETSSGRDLFEPGELALYNIRCFFATVGKGEIEYVGSEELGGLPVHHVRSSFSRPGAVDNEDIYGTFGELLPLIVKREISTLCGLRLETERYDQENFNIRIDKKKGDITTREIISSDGNIQNLILLFYYLRQQKLEPGREIPVNLPSQKFVLEVKGLAEVEVPYGSFRAYEVSSGDGELRIWISVGENPVILKAALSSSLFGRYSLVLTGLGRRTT